MPAGVAVEVDDGFARITFLDSSKRGAGLTALLDTGSPVQVDTSGSRKAYIVPEGNAREAGLLEVPTSTDETAEKPKSRPAAKATPAKKAPAKKAAPAAAKKEEASDGKSEGQN